jgi:hydroxymethylpyrimidine pyrophosphatase-like HAD family hydrolase
MLARALALDFDGTIAVDGRIEAEVLAAVGEARGSGLVVILATGRRLDDLQALLVDLTIFDAVVAENGAIVYIPESGRCTVETPGPPDDFVEALRRRGLHVERGASVVEADAEAAPIIVDEIRRQELPLVLLFNRGLAMVLPQGVSKGTGLRSALDTLRISPHNTVARGHRRCRKRLFIARGVRNRCRCCLGQFQSAGSR